MKRYFTLLLILCVSFPIAQANSENHDNQKIKFSLVESAPYVVVKDNIPRGIFVDILEKLRSEVDFIGEPRIAPFQRLKVEHSRGEIDCTIMAYVPKILGRFTLFFPIGIELPLGVVVGRGIKIQQYEDLAGKMIAVVRGTSFGERFDTDPDLKKMYVSNYLKAVKFLEEGKVQVAVGALPSLESIIKTRRSEYVFSNDQLKFQILHLGVACQPSEDPLRAQDIIVLEKLIDDLRENGHFSQLEYKYFGDLPYNKNKFY